MKKADLIPGRYYFAKINGLSRIVRLDLENRDSLGLRYEVSTHPGGKKHVLRSGAKFLSALPNAPSDARSSEFANHNQVDSSPIEDEDPQPSSANVETVVVRPAVKLSPLAERIRSHKANLIPHLIIQAGAGTGKTTTLIEGFKYVRGIGSAITPSEEQQAIWDMMAKSNSGNVCMVAFNKAIADTLRRRVPSGVQAMTMHQLGLRAVHNTWKLLPGQGAINGWKVQELISKASGQDIRQLRQMNPILVTATDKLVGLCKSNLVDPTPDNLDFLSSRYEIELDKYSSDIYPLVSEVYELCKDIEQFPCVDFNDMIWLPVIHDLHPTKYTDLYVDEAQDLNSCQQALAMMFGERLTLIGDARQSIYAFTGADSMSMSRMYERLSNTDRGCVTLPLTVTRRCGKAIVREANKIVSDFHAHDSNPEGRILTSTMDQYRKHVSPGDMIICRVNAPLVSECFKFLREGIKAQIQGKDVGNGLIQLIKKFKAENIEQLIKSLGDWADLEVRKEKAKKFPSDDRFIAIQDKLDCLECFCDSAKSVDDVIKKVESMFTSDPQTNYVLLSSGHKAKGLEADTVFFLEPNGASIPHPMAKTPTAREQEMNLRYVVITRAINTLVYVS